jgi:2-oxoglutarate ferredoxin oxidoreductase subunit alpha
MKPKRKNKTLMSGNEAMGLGAFTAGCRFYAGYPITPQNELTAYMASCMRLPGRTFVQAESELAAINMVFGASAAGFRTMTSSSSPGISLKQEGISYLAGAQLPAVIINVSRGGPGLGNIASSQSDYFQSTRGGGHGDYFTPVLSPWSVEEAFNLAILAFDVADFYRTPVLVLADAIIGQMMEPINLNRKPLIRNRKPKRWSLTGAKNRPPNIVKSFFLQEGLLEEHNLLLEKKWQKIKLREQRSSIYGKKKVDCLIVAYGSQARIARQAVDVLSCQGIKAGLFRPITLWPYPDKALKKAASLARKIVVVEQSLGQMVEDVRLALPNKEINFLGKTGGGIPSSLEIVKFVKKLTKN